MKGCIMLLIMMALVMPFAQAQNASITYGDNARHIARIKGDSIILVSGSTYSFTVDTPEDKGRISTNATVEQFLREIQPADGSRQIQKLLDQSSNEKKEGVVLAGDKLQVSSADGKVSKTYFISLRPGALGGQLKLEREQITVNTSKDLTLYYSAGQRSPDAAVRIYIPKGILVTPENTTVNVIGRGDVKLKELETQSIGRTGSKYRYKKIGSFSIENHSSGSSVLILRHLDLRPDNGIDLKITISKVCLANAGSYVFKSEYTTSEPEVLTSAGSDSETAILIATKNISDFERVVDNGLRYLETPGTYLKAEFRWTPKPGAGMQLMQSTDEGRTWMPSMVTLHPGQSRVTVSGLNPGRLYFFRLKVKNEKAVSYSNTARFYSGKMDVKNFGVKGDGITDDTEGINKAISFINELGGGTLFFGEGEYPVRTVYLKSNVYLYISKSATIKAIKGADEPEATWFSDKGYRSGLSPTASGPYDDSENWLTKQDVGHHYFRNSMFFGQRLDNVKIIGNGRITGNGNLVTGDRVMNNPAGNRADKMFTLKLCTNIEIGGLHRNDDLWYDEKKDEPYYINNRGEKDFNVGNMLQIDRGGHFVLLATGTDHVHVHDTYFARNSSSNARDIYDFMQCNDVTVTNIYSKVSSDDIVKPGSDCSLGFTRPASNYKVRNIIGDTNCNLFQIGSETADDIRDVHVDNIYVLGANKAGFSISTNDGAHIKDIHLNCGHTGKLHARSKMYRTTTPFFISISNRGRVLGAEVSRFKFEENGVQHDELLVTNINIGVVENIILNGIDIMEVYGGSSYGNPETRWKPYDGKQKRASPIVAGYSLPSSSKVEGGLDFTLPNGNHTGYIRNIVFNDVQVLVKGGNPLSDTAAIPPELGVGQYNVSNLKVQPSYGLWARHVRDLTVKDCSFNFEEPDGRYALYLDDVVNARISGSKMMKHKEIGTVIKLKNATSIQVDRCVYYTGKWGQSPVAIPDALLRENETTSLPIKSRNK
jgi:polygalacturonase